MDIEKWNLEMFSQSIDYLKNSRASIPADYITFIHKNIDMKDKRKVLDVGCGIGYIAKTIKDINLLFDVYGIDISKELIDVAKKDIKNIEFRVGDVYSIPFDDNTFDITICQTLFIYLKNPLKALKEMIRVTKRGGRIVVMEPIWHIDGYNRYAPGEFGKKIKLQDELIQFEFKKKLAEGIDPFITRKIPSMFMSCFLNNVRIDTYNSIKFETETEIDDKEKNIEAFLSPYYKMMIELGYPKEKILEIIRLENKYKRIKGEFELITLIYVEGIK